MKIAALILGILAGLSGLPIATMGHALVGAGGGSGGSLLYLLPIASFLGGGLALNVPAASGALLLGSAFFWFLLGASAGYGINIITIGAVALNGIGGFLALAAFGQENSSNVGSGSQLTMAGPSSIGPPSAQSEGQPSSFSPSTKSAYQYDRAKWQALLEFDPDIARVEEKLRPFGTKYVDQFAAGYLILNDKNYLPNIVQKVIETARQDAAQAKAEEERWGKRFSDPAFLIKLADEKLDFLLRAPFGNVAILKKGPVLVERDGQITTYPDVYTLREAQNDNGEWPLITDNETKLRLIKLIAQQI